MWVVQKVSNSFRGPQADAGDALQLQNGRRLLSGVPGTRPAPVSSKVQDTAAVAVPHSAGDDDDSVKSSTTGGIDAWNPDKYANIWVCTLSGGLLGYAQFPGGPKKTDGVVILNSAFGTKGTATTLFDLGRTTVHDFGHYFNLRHIWGDTPDCSGGDFVPDTPNAGTANTGKPSFPSISCSNGPNGDMFMDYMDYTDDDSMCMFTPGQVARMHATLEGPRKSLVT